jgi:hypothetical protein
MEFDSADVEMLMPGWNILYIDIRAYIGITHLYQYGKLCSKTRAKQGLKIQSQTGKPSWTTFNFFSEVYGLYKRRSSPQSPSRCHRRAHSHSPPSFSK